MNSIEIRITVMILMSMILQKSHSSQSQISFSKLDKKQMSEAFADLLNSLIRVNEQRVDALNDFFKLNDFNVAKRIVRSGQEEDREPIVALFVADLDKDDKHQLQIDDKKLDSDSDESDISSDNLTEERSDRSDDLLLRIRKIKDPSDSESSNEVISSEKNKAFNYTDTILTDSSLEEDRMKPSKARQTVCKGDALKDCTSACKEAYRYSCVYYTCSSSLYRRLRKECTYSCKYRFKYHVT